jgi:hypothetical protein
MNYDTNAIVREVQESSAALLGMVEHAACGHPAEDLARLKGDVHRTVMMMIAAIVLADQKYAEGERAFVNLLVDWSGHPGGEMQCLREHAEAWNFASLKVPEFFTAAAEHDRRQHTKLAQAMMREIQLIGDNACISDGHFEATEHAVVKRYVAFLQEFLADWNSRHGPFSDTAADGWASV